MTRLLAFVLLLLPPLQRSWAATDPVGMWLTQNHEAVIAIAPCGTALCGRIAGFFLDRPSDPTPVDYRGVSQCQLPLISNAVRVRQNLWKGHITDPRDGHVFGVELHIDQRGNLALRGFLGLPLLGHTQIWTRYNALLPRDCRILTSRSVDRRLHALPNRYALAQ